jgi:hypothetical protein
VTADAEVRHLRRIALAILLFLAAFGVASVIVVVLLLDSSRTSDLRRLAVISLFSGIAGAVARGVLETIERLGLGWELRDGTQIVRRELRKQRYREEIERRAAGVTQTTEVTPPSKGRRVGSERDDDESARQQRADQAHYERMGDPEYQRRQLEQDEVRELAMQAQFGIDIYFGAHVLPFLIALPFVGAVLGLALFAGVTGGLLLASAEQTPTYSPSGLVFLAFLAGFFAETFLVRLRNAADALFGTERQKEQPSQSQDARRGRD